MRHMLAIVGDAVISHSDADIGLLVRFHLDKTK